MFVSEQLFLVLFGPDRYVCWHESLKLSLPDLYILLFLLTRIAIGANHSALVIFRHLFGIAKAITSSC